LLLLLLLVLQVLLLMMRGASQLLQRLSWEEVSTLYSGAQDVEVGVAGLLRFQGWLRWILVHVHWALLLVLLLLLLLRLLLLLVQLLLLLLLPETW
jgi:hypothetical protein